MLTVFFEKMGEKVYRLCMWIRKEVFKSGEIDSEYETR